MQSNMQSAGISFRATISVRGSFFFYVFPHCYQIALPLPFYFFTPLHLLLSLSNLTSLPFSSPPPLHAFLLDVRHKAKIKLKQRYSQCVPLFNGKSLLMLSSLREEKRKGRCGGRKGFQVLKFLPDSANGLGKKKTKTENVILFCSTW